MLPHLVQTEALEQAEQSEILHRTHFKFPDVLSVQTEAAKIIIIFILENH